MKRTIQKHALVAALWSLAFTVLPVHAADDAAQLQQGKVLFGQGAVPACALCHALKDAGAEGAVGPSLDELKPDAKRVLDWMVSQDAAALYGKFKEISPSE